MSWSKPLYILAHSKKILREAIVRDASFLEKNGVMDYSLLVGLNSNDKLLVLGIIGKMLNSLKNLLKNINFVCSDLKIIFVHLHWTSALNRSLNKLVF